MVESNKIVKIPDYQAINILVKSEMDIKEAISKIFSKERIDKIGYHNLTVLCKIMNENSECEFSIYTSYIKDSKIDSNLIHLKKIKDCVYYYNEDEINNQEDKIFDFDNQEIFNKNNKIIYVTKDNKNFFGNFKDVPTIY